MALSETLKEFGVKISLLFDKKKAEEAHKRVEELGKQMRELGLHVAEASAALFEMANLTGENARSLEENSQMLGINVERMQELEYAAKVMANVGRGELVGALESVSNVLDQVRHGNIEAGIAFQRLGVSQDMLIDRSITADQVMGVLADRLKSIQDPTAKLRLATQAFGSAGAKLLPLLNKGSAGMAAMGVEARSLGVILSKEAIEKGAEFDRQLSKVWIVLKNVSFTIGNQLIKYLYPMVIQFERFVVANKAFISTGIAAVMKGLGQYLEIVFKTVKVLADRFVYLVHVLGGVEKVSKAIAIALGIFSAAKVIAGVGTLVTSFRALGLVMTAISPQMVAIGAGLIALILVVQDLFSDDSIIKEWIGMFAEKFPNATKFAVGGFELLRSIVRQLVTDFEAMFTVIGKVFGVLEGVGEWIAKTLHLADALRDVVAGFGVISDFIGKGLGAAGDFMSSAALATPTGAAAGAGSMSTQNTFNAEINVGVPPGTSASQATSIVSGGVRDGFDQMLRQNRTPALGGRAY